MNKKLFAALSGVILCVAANSAIAGPDWALIEKARAAKQAENQQKAAELAAQKALTVAQNKDK